MAGWFQNQSRAKAQANKAFSVLLCTPIANGCALPPIRKVSEWMGTYRFLLRLESKRLQNLLSLLGDNRICQFTQPIHFHCYNIAGL
jgi:hypothetical protein